jgi:hypothetical protein
VEVWTLQRSVAGPKGPLHLVCRTCDCPGQDSTFSGGICSWLVLGNTENGRSYDKTRRRVETSDVTVGSYGVDIFCVKSTEKFHITRPVL